MPDRRKTKEELREEALGDRNRDRGSGSGSGSGSGRGDRSHTEPTPDTDPRDGPPPDVAPDMDVPMTAVSDAERDDVNRLFNLLNRQGFETTGGYQLATEAPDAPTVVTLSVVLPSTNDWDPSEAYRDG